MDSVQSRKFYDFQLIIYHLVHKSQMDLTEIIFHYNQKTITSMSLLAAKSVQTSPYSSQTEDYHQHSTFCSSPYEAQHFLPMSPLHKNCSQTQSTDEELSSLETEPFILRINCYEQSYSINLSSLQSIKSFIYQIDHTTTITNNIKKSLILVVIQRASQVNQHMGDLWQQVKKEYEDALSVNIFNQ